MNIGIFGGTFDPVHRGHLEVARKAKEQYHLQKVIFIPALIPPHKLERRDLAPAPYRLKMLELAIAGEPAFEVSEIELNRPDVSFTVDTIRELKTQYPEDRFFLILGADSLLNLSTWHQPDRIRQEAKILAAPRPGCEAAVNAMKEAGVIEMPHCGYSSSEIRKRLSRGEPVEDMLPPEIARYIREKGIYRSKRAK